MYKMIRIAVVALYVFLTGCNFLLTLAISGIYISWWTCAIAMTAWGLSCWLSVYFISPVHLFFHGRLRKPVMEEEARLKGCLTEVLKSASCERKFRLRIVEEKEEKVLSIGHDTIAISASLLKQLTDEELKGMMAHELGHLINRDTMVSWAFATANHLPRVLRRCLPVWKSLAWGALLLFILLLVNTRLTFLTAAVLLFILWSVAMDILFRRLNLLLVRWCDYDQDAFAYRLGYGRGLRDALIKRAQYGAEQVNAWFILLHGTAPIVYDRIRRLEELLQWRMAGSPKDQSDQ